MSSDTSTSTQMRVGLFVGLGLILFMASILFLGGDRAFFKKTYILKIKLKTVQGLNEGSVVSLSGVNVGNVKSIDFLPNEGLLDVSCEIDQTFNQRITEGSQASIKTQGALGDKFVYIEPGQIGAPPLKDGAYLASNLEGDLFDKILEKGGQITNVVDVINEALTLLKNLNANGKSAQVTGKVVRAADAAEITLQEMRKLSKDMRGGDEQGLKQAVAHLNSILSKLDRGEGTLGALINDRGVYDRISQIVGVGARNQAIKSIVRDSIQKGEQRKQ